MYEPIHFLFVAQNYLSLHSVGSILNGIAVAISSRGRPADTFGAVHIAGDTPSVIFSYKAEEISYWRMQIKG